MFSQTEEVSRLRQQIADLKSQWPAHSVPPALMQELDDLEEALEKALSAGDESEAGGRHVPDPHL
jgi:predicted transcriptional regulator